MPYYRSLNKQVFFDGKYSLVPIRFEDRYDIMQWRNEQIYHLRQSTIITRPQQDHYFETVISTHFDEEQPDQILFSYVKNGKCIGYGGLVHIDWVNKNAEISFIIDTKLELDGFIFHWKNYLSLIEEVAFSELGLHKISTFAYDLRPKLYKALEESGYKEEATLKEHCRVGNGYLDVKIHVKFNPID